MTLDTLLYIPSVKLRDLKYVSIEWCDELDSKAAAVRCIQSMCAIGYVQFIIITESYEDIEDWRDKMTDLKLPKYRINQINRCAYKNMHFYKDNIYDLIILDKLDKMQSEVNWEILEQMYHRSMYNKPRILSLSKPNLDLSIKRKIEDLTGSSFTTYYTYNLALMEGLIIKPKIHLVPIHLSRVPNECRYQIERGIIQKRTHVLTGYSSCQEYLDKSKYPDIDLTILCSVNERYSIYSDLVDVNKQKAKETQSRSALDKWLMSKNERLKFISEQKMPFISHFLQCKFMKDNHFVYLGSSIRECFKMGAEKCATPKNNYNADALRLFNTQELNGLFQAGILLDGTNYKMCNVVIVSQLDRRIFKLFDQLRLPLRDGDPDVFIFYCKETRDEDYVSALLKSIDKSQVDIMSPNDVCNVQSTLESSETEDAD